MLELQIYDFLKLGLGDPIPVSATVGRGIGELLDLLVGALPAPETPDESTERAIRVALVGRPNVGKSSFINRLVGHDRLIVTPIAGTTRDAVDTPFEFNGQKYIMIDTAGLRRRYKVHENVEFYTNLRTDRAIESCDVAVVLLDASSGMSTQDLRVLDKVFGTRRAAILAVNKWDLIEKDSHTADEYTRQLHDVLTQHSHVPVIYVSALTGLRVAKVLELVKAIDEENHRRISTSELNDFLKRATAAKNPPASHGKYIKFSFLTQSEVAPPTFVFFANHPELLAKSYISYLTNQLRATFGFNGVPIRLKFRNK